MVFRARTQFYWLDTMLDIRERGFDDVVVSDIGTSVTAEPFCDSF